MGIHLTGQLSDSFGSSDTMSALHYKSTGEQRKPRVLLVNDDGPPSKYSPHVLGLYDQLTAIGWEVTVVLPSFQKSWGSMQFSLQGPVSYWYYYPIKLNSDGTHPQTSESWSATRRPVNRERGEVGEWILVDGSPTTACNSGLFNQNAFFGETDEARTAPPSTKTPFDLVLSGPNFGRNTGTAFALSSGTLGAALAASLAGVRSIAISYGHFALNPPTLADRSRAKGPGIDPVQLKELGAKANALAVELVQKLWSNWDNESDVGCYSINVPLAETILQPEVVWTRIWENRYGPLFALQAAASYGTAPAPLPATAPTPQHSLHFAPNMGSLLGPKKLTPGTDVWAILNGYISITRLRPNFMEVDHRGNGLETNRVEPGAGAADTSLVTALEDGLDVGKRWRL